MRQLWGRAARGLAAWGGALLLAGCAQNVVWGVAPPAESWPAPPPPVEAVPRVAVPAVPLNNPVTVVSDPEAQRFHALKRLAQEGIIRPDEADGRRTANLGALLPYSAPAPAADLARPAPLQDIMDKLARLSVTPAGSGSAAAEREFLMDNILPLAPRTRAVPARTESQAFKLGRDRVDTLARTGLVSTDERMREIAAIAQAERVLANKPPPPPPPAPAKKKPARKKAPAGGSAGAKPGDVPGGAIPVPPGAAKGPIGVHLLSMASDSLTAKAVDALKKEYPELAPLEFKAVKTDIPDLGTTYRLLAGPMSQAEAESLCGALRAKGQSCAVASY